MASHSPLVVSDTVLGFGLHGTVVFQGSLQGCAVAVKRLPQEFVSLASHEVSILQKAKDHPNVIRYYYQETHANFLYIALELCSASLADIVENPDREQWREIAISFDRKKALKEITNGLRHIHALELVHRNIKPQNILVSNVTLDAGGKTSYRMLISDFGLCKKIDVDQPRVHGAMDTNLGWRAPETLRGKIKSDGSPDNPKAVDMFALGCLFYYTLTKGSHPFGDRFQREASILKGERKLDRVKGAETVDLITQMLDPTASKRPDTTACLVHPFFWDLARRLNFLQDASDRFEIMFRNPKDPKKLALEAGAFTIVGDDWFSRLDESFINTLGKFRRYDGRSVQDLLRALCNRKHHYPDLPDDVQQLLGPMPEGFLSYFTGRFPQLLLHVHSVVGSTSLRTESMFRAYFDFSM